MLSTALNYFLNVCQTELEDDVKSMSVYLIVGSQKSNSLVLTYDKSLEVRDSPTFRLDHDFISLMRKGDPNLTFRVFEIVYIKV